MSDERPPSGDEPQASRDGIAVVDIFCGAGGLSLGLKKAGLRIAAGIDLDPACAFPFERNIGAPFHRRDVAALTSAEVQEMFGEARIRVLAGCAPCQPFSGYTTRRRATDDRWRLLLDFLRLVDDVRPEVVTLENVPRLTLLPLWSRFVSSLEELGYAVNWRVIDVADYGVPQQRRRVVLLASRMGPIEVPPPRTRRATVRSAIGRLAHVAAGERCEKDALHASRRLTTINLTRIRASRPAGTWREWPEDMRVDCHRTVKGKTYPSVYGRMSWDRPSPTITTQFFGFGNGRFGHPEQDRALTLREGAILQSFPKKFAFVPEGERINFLKIGMLIGNAVPPKLGSAIGEAILGHLASGRMYSLASR
ncbi:DNA cytosine methyltransferase [Methylorubrum populi]|uniref:DNA cytosine methyltransferase n=1 Tax=Methylorubrum populi TaxID=223967 RepID=UPI003F658657